MKNLMLILTAGVVLSGQAQNLVPNGSFEFQSTCPWDYSQVNFALNWNKSFTNNHGSNNDHTDYFSSCTTGQFSTPANVWGNQAPADGRAYVGMTTKYTPYGVDYRENIYVKLSNPLVIGTPYYVSFQASLADDFCYGSDKLGIKFSTVPGFDINNFAHLFSATPITNKTGWVTVQGIVVADSTYNFLGLGNFFTDAMTNEIVDVNPCSLAANLYYIDNVKVFKVCEWVDSVRTDSVIDNGDGRIRNTTSTQPEFKSGTFNCFPTPANNEITIVYSFPENHGIFELDLLDQKGMSVKQSKLGTKNSSIADLEISDLPPGIYLSILKCNGQILSSQKIIKN